MNFKTFITSPKMVLTTVVWGACFKVSANHAIDSAIKFGNTRSDAMFYPVIIDALIVACALWVSSPKGVNKATRLWAAFGRYFGFVATVFVNVVHTDFSAYQGNGAAIVIAGLINLLPAVGVIAMTEVFVHGMKSTPAARANSKAKATGGNVVPMRKAR